MPRHYGKPKTKKPMPKKPGAAGKPAGVPPWMMKKKAK